MMSHIGMGHDPNHRQHEQDHHYNGNDTRVQNRYPPSHQTSPINEYQNDQCMATLCSLPLHPTYPSTMLSPSTRSQPQLLPQIMPSWPSVLTNPANYMAPPVAMPHSASPTNAPKFHTISTGKKLTNDDRRSMCQYHEKHPTMKPIDIGATFGVGRSTVYKVLGQKEKYLFPEDRSASPVKEPKGENGSPGEDGRRGRKKYQCKDCEKSYSRAYHLSRHRLIHTRERIHTCNIGHCNRQFVRSDVFKRHRERHTAPECQLQKKDVSSCAGMTGEIQRQASEDNSPDSFYHSLAEAHLNLDTLKDTRLQDGRQWGFTTANSKWLDAYDAQRPLAANFAVPSQGLQHGDYYQNYSGQSDPNGIFLNQMGGWDTMHSETSSYGAPYLQNQTTSNYDANSSLYNMDREL